MDAPMATYLDMQKLAQSPGAVTMLASYLLNINTVEWTDWELDFLEGMARRTSTDPISTRQREVLVELKDNATSHTTTRDGQSVRALILRCWEARLDLDEEDEQFVADLYTSRLTALKPRQLSRLQRCVNNLNIYG
jgi:tRNA splicing ligase